MYNKFNTFVLEELINVADKLKNVVGMDEKIYFADFIAATKKLKDNIYPKMGVMIIPTLEDSRKLDVQSEICLPPSGLVG